MIIQNIFNIKFKLGEKYSNEHIYLSNDNMYISYDFFYYLMTNKNQLLNIKKHEYYNLCIYLRIKDYIKLTLYAKYIEFSNENLKNYKFIICGSSGDYGFNGMERTTKLILGINTKRKVNRYLIKKYLESPLCRYEKIKKLKEKINQIKFNEIL
jgi:hypothetical protein